jgi:uncharacterized protein (DUF2062 family)
MPVGESNQRRSLHPLFKRILRFLPRRARLHRYPLIGRFAADLRKRSYLWSFRRKHVRPAYYAGAVVSFLPLFGIQLPISLLAAVLLRSNFMVLGGLQLITNPLTAAPVYYATHQLGALVIDQFQGTHTPLPTEDKEVMKEFGGYVADTVSEPLVSDKAPVKWSARARDAVFAMSVGGVIVGLGVAAVLDVIDALLRRPHRRVQKAEPGRIKSVVTTGPPDPDETRGPE